MYKEKEVDKSNRPNLSEKKRGNKEVQINNQKEEDRTRSIHSVRDLIRKKEWFAW